MTLAAPPQDARTAAHHHAYALFEAVQCQDADGALAALPVALDVARGEGWTEVAFVLCAARAVHCVTRPDGGAAAGAVASLLRQAEALDAAAFVALALGLRAVVAATTGDPAALLDHACRAVVLLDNDALPPLDRCTAYVVAAAAFNTLQLWELVDELWTRATDQGPASDASGQTAAVAVNRVLTRLEWALALLEHGDEEGARRQLDRVEDAAPVALARLLPPLWRVNVEACLDVVALLRDGRGDGDDRDDADGSDRGARLSQRVAAHLDALRGHGDLEVLPLLEAADVLARWRRGHGSDAEAARRLAPPRSASSGARSFPSWVRATVLSAACPDDAVEATRQHAALVSRLRWESRLVVLAAARAQLDAERRRREHERLTQAVHTDPLTGLQNRRSFDAWLGGGAGRPRSALLLLDLDGFKQINDAFGHDVGDEVLRRVGRIVSASIRPGDQAVRQGGDEFAVLLEGDQVAPGAALQRARDLCRDISGEPWEEVAPGLAVTATAGLALVGPEQPQATPRDVYRAADAALYEAKRSHAGVVLAQGDSRA